MANRQTRTAIPYGPKDHFTVLRRRHQSGPLYCLKQGMMIVKTESGVFANPPHFIGWIPPGYQHAIAGQGHILGWTVFIRPQRADLLPKKPMVLACSKLIEPLVEHMAAKPPEFWPRQLISI